MDSSYLTRLANYGASLFQSRSEDDDSDQDIIEKQHARSALSEKSHIGESLIHQFVVIDAPGYPGEWLGIVLDTSKNAVSDFEYKVYFPSQIEESYSNIGINEYIIDMLKDVDYHYLVQIIPL